MSSKKQRQKLAKRRGREKKTLYMKQREYKKHPCPNCNTVLDGVTGVSDKEENTIPTIGAVSICLYCATVLVFEKEGFSFGSKALFEKKAGAMLQTFEDFFRQKGMKIQYRS